MKYHVELMNGEVATASYFVDAATPLAAASKATGLTIVLRHGAEWSWVRVTGHGKKTYEFGFRE
jgi:hypothetical protein